MSQNIDLSDYKTAGQPTSIGELDAETASSIVEKFRELEQWQHRVHINDREAQYLIGDRAGDASKSFYVYRLPDDPTGVGVAGVLGLDRTYDEPNTVGFVPAGDEADEDTIAEPVETLNVASDTRTDRLSTVLDRIRTELTGSDWSSGRADTSTPEWTAAHNTLMDYYKENADDATYNIPGRFLDGISLFAIARYPGDAEKLLSSAAMQLDRIDNPDEDGRYVTTPFALRRLLLDYAARNVDTDDFDVHITSS